MEPPTHREVTLPAELLSELAPDASTRERVGVAFGRRLAEGIVRSADAPRDVGTFWSRLSGQLGERGWGTVDHQRVHPGLGLVTSRDWAEADDPTRTECSFGIGVLRGALAAVAGGREVAVIETACRRAGSDGCTFAFGSRGAVAQVRDALAAGRSLDDAIASLTR